MQERKEAVFFIRPAFRHEIEQEFDTSRIVRTIAIAEESPELRLLKVLFDSVPLRADFYTPLEIVGVEILRKQQRLDQFGIGKGNTSDVQANEESGRIDVIGFVPDDVNQVFEII